MFLDLLFNSFPEKPAKLPSDGMSEGGYRCLIFSTSLQNNGEVARISESLSSIPGILDWSVDLENWEKVLRVEGIGIMVEIIKDILREEGVYIREIEI